MNFDAQSLKTIHCSLMRPILEYSPNAFRTTLMEKQLEDLERLQRRTLKAIYGQQTSYSDCLQKTEIERLDDRRERIFRAFKAKCYESGYFGSRWFVEKPASHYGLRKTDKVVQNFAQCDRLRFAPLYEMRRMINSRL